VEPDRLLLRLIIGLLYQLWKIYDDDDDDDDDSWVIGKGNQSTRRIPSPVPLCPPRIPHDMPRAGTRPAVGGIRQLTTWDRLDWNNSYQVQIELESLTN
jgi:hypothetical protein